MVITRFKNYQIDQNEEIRPVRMSIRTDRPSGRMGMRTDGHPHAWAIRTDGPSARMGYPGQNLSPLLCCL